MLGVAQTDGCMAYVLIISAMSSNQSHGEYPDCRSERESGGEASLLVSPLVVAGIVIGLVLFLSCITIITGSLRKDSRLRNPHFGASYGQDGFSFGGSAGELRSSCLEDFPPGLDFDSFRESLPQISSLYPDSPPRYDECVGPDLTQIYVPTDDPPPYSLLDPRVSLGGPEEQPPHSGPSDASQYCGETSVSTAWSSSSSSSSSHCSLGQHEWEQQQPLPLLQCNLNKHSDWDYDENSQQLPANHSS